MTSASAPTHLEVQPVRKIVDVKAPIEVAFRVFTAEMTSWWDLENYHIGKARAVVAYVEPCVGGRWFERAEDGSECEWGKVLVWEPPDRLVLAWQISSTWQFDPTVHSEVEVRFQTTGPGITRVELEHRRLETYGNEAAQMRGIFESEQGWSHLMAAFARAAEL